MDQGQIDYLEVVRELVLKLEELAFGEHTYQAMNGQTLYNRKVLENTGNHHDWARDYVQVTAQPDGGISVVIDTSKMVIILDSGVDRAAKLKLMQDALVKCGIDVSKVVPQDIKISEYDERLFSRPKLEFTIADGSKAFQTLGGASRNLLYGRIDTAYGEKKDEQAARKVIDTYVHGHAAETIHQEFTEFLNKERNAQHPVR
jgi:hypothetical protein